MGMFDTVKVPCPQCGAYSEFQSKGGDCGLHYYSLDNAPDDVMKDVNRHAPNTCESCGTIFEVKAIYQIIGWESVVADDGSFETYREE